MIRKISGKQNLYTKNDKNMFFLCAYANVILKENGVFLGRTDRESGLLFQMADNEGFFNIFVELRGGLNQDALAEKAKTFIDEEEIETFISRLIQEGIIE